MKRIALGTALALFVLGLAHAGQNVRNGSKYEFLIDDDTVLVRASVKEVKKLTYIQCSYFDAETNDYFGQAKGEFSFRPADLLTAVITYCTGAWPVVEAGNGRS
jgi:hypothetical protein